MAKMSETQRHTILSFNDAQANRGLLTAFRHSTIKALVRNGWAFYPKGWPSSLRRVTRSAYVTSQGLRAAGYDFDAVHGIALAENELIDAGICGCTRNPLGHSYAEHPTAPMSAEERDAHSSAYWESATAGLPREPAF